MSGRICPRVKCPTPRGNVLHSLCMRRLTRIATPSIATVAGSNVDIGGPVIRLTGCFIWPRHTETHCVRPDEESLLVRANPDWQRFTDEALEVVDNVATAGYTMS